MDLTPKPVPANERVDKNSEKYAKIVAAWAALPIGQCIEVMKVDVSPATLEAKARKIIIPATGEKLKLGKIRDANKKLSGIRLSKIAAEPKA